MPLGLLSKKKRKIMSGVAFVPFVPTASAHDGEIDTITVLSESHVGISFMKIILTFRFLVFEVMMKLTYSLLFTHKR